MSLPTAKPPVHMIPIAEIKDTFFVRTELNEDRVKYFVGLYEAGADVKPIKIVRDLNELVDGRHRKAALLRLERTEAPCILREPAPLPELLMEAMADNMGGALPPTEADINHVIKQLLELKVTRAEIIEKIEKLTPFPKKLLIRYIDNVQSEMGRARLKQAAQAVLQGDMTVKDAAAKFDVNIDTLKRELNPDSKDTTSKLGFNRQAAMVQITTRFKSMSQTNSALVRNVMKDHDAGDASTEDVYAVLDKIASATRSMRKSHEEWRKRFDTKVNPTAATGLPTESKKRSGSKRAPKPKDATASEVKQPKPGKSLGDAALDKMGLGKNPNQ